SGIAESCPRWRRRRASRRAVPMACLPGVRECGSWQRHLEGFVGCCNGEPREKRREIGREIEARVRGERQGRRHAERIASGKTLQESFGTGRQTAQLDIEPGAANKRILAA